jgi:hypothetical protein
MIELEYGDVPGTVVDGGCGDSNWDCKSQIVFEGFCWTL